MGNCMVQVDSHDKRDIAVFDSIYLSRGNVADLFSLFNEVDVDGSGAISMTEFLVIYRLESTPLIELILGSFNEKNLNFLEFACLLWNFLSMDENRLSAYMFFICNFNKKKVVPFSHISKSYRLIHGQFKGNMKLIAPLSAIEAKCGDTGVTMTQFVDFCSQYPIICHPLVLVQFNFKDKILGQKFWNTMCGKRCRHDAKHLMDPHFVYGQISSRRAEQTILNAEVSRQRNGGRTSFARRLSVQLAGQKQTKVENKHSTRKKQTKIGNAARRLSTTLLNIDSGSVKSVVPKKINSKEKKTKREFDIEARYGYAIGDPDDDPDYVPAELEDGGDSKQGDFTLSINNDAIKGESKSQSSKSKKKFKGKTKQVHPEYAEVNFHDDIMHEDENLEEQQSPSKNTRSKKGKKSKNVNNLAGAVRRLSTTIISATTKKSKKRDRSQQYAAGN